VYSVVNEMFISRSRSQYKLYILGGVRSFNCCSSLLVVTRKPNRVLCFGVGYTEVESNFVF
jgi:hypothetical protein